MMEKKLVGIVGLEELRLEFVDGWTVELYEVCFNSGVLPQTITY
jgi:hypothetical protein